MSKPSEEELKTALAQAASMRESGADPYFLAKTLLSHHYRLGLLEAVYQALERYLHSGQAEAEHQHLLKVMDKVRQAEDHTARIHPDEFGLA